MSILATIEKRLRELMSVGERLDDAKAQYEYVKGKVDPKVWDATFLAHCVEASILRYVNALLAPNMARAVLKRDYLAERWPIDTFAPQWLELPDVDVHDILLALVILTDHTRDAEGVWVTLWPFDISPGSVADALLATDDEAAHLVAKRIRSGKKDEPTKEEHDAALHWSPKATAMVLEAQRQIREEIYSFAPVPLPAAKEARAAMVVVSQGRKGPWIEHVAKSARYEMVWNGKPRQYQLCLDFAKSFEAKIVESILDELQEDGLRDYLVLHRMAAEHGRTGQFAWTWEEHRARTSYDRQISQKNKSDRELALEVTNRLWRLKNAEIRQTIEHTDGSEKWVRIGPHGLIDIPGGGRKYGDSVDRLILSLNPALYDGAHHESDKPYFAFIPNEALSLPGKYLRLATLLTFAMRGQHDDEGHVVLSMRTLWEYLNASGGKPDSRHWGRANEALRRALEKLKAINLIEGFESDDGVVHPDTMFRIAPSAPWKDLIVHAVLPNFGPNKSALPRTGAELRKWRESKQLSQVGLATALGVGTNTVKRAEARPREALGAAISEALVAARS